MPEIVKLRKGLNIRLRGSADKTIDFLPDPVVVALKPTDFPGLTPKLVVKQDQEVKAGDVLFFDKYNSEIVFTSPVGGRVISINRGERRKILEVVIETNENAGSVEFKKADPLLLSRDEIKEQLLKSGIWPFIKRRPYGIIALPNEKPLSIYISTFDTAPLAPDYNFILNGQTETFQTGINALVKLTDGKVYLGINENSIFNSVQNVVIKQFSGPHPAGNVGIQIHNINPINKGDVVWTINVQDVLFIGRLFETGKVDFSKIVALVGSEVKNPKYYNTVLGASISSIVDGKLLDSGHKQRIISGNVLTGTKVTPQNYLSFYDSTVTVIPEGDEYELFGWAMPGMNKFSASKTFLAKLFPKKEYELNANMHGGERAFVLSGQYEKLLPMDILPVYLLKAILANDIDKMEQLGIYEVVEEDLALCEYACTSKIKVQDILRSGISLVIKELG
ncbi:MAG: Na(+)-translocating NADH-quinone reductase subunit A [Bacteroidales bacterium]|jgi:Na+-transporting NADH:ubiquinone oxidoreductase subunit A|nr:Na(+)-translocating NADH-quinone reductase subunit A [Bacteroidales bacterium]